MSRIAKPKPATVVPSRMVHPVQSIPSVQSSFLLPQRRCNPRGRRTLRPASGIARLHQPVLVGVDRRLDAIAKAKLVEDAPDMGLDRGLAQEQARGDLDV
jgi:hypothetical protein